MGELMGRPPRIDLYDVAKKIILKRDGNRCTKCGSQSSLIVHHKRPDAKSLDDFITLCTTCHNLITSRNPGNRETLHFKKTRGRVVTYLYPIEVGMLDHVCQKAGETRSELLRRLLKNYLEEINVVKEYLHGEKKLHKTA